MCTVLTIFVSSVCLLAYKSPHLIVYCDSGVEIYDADQAKWIQTIPIRKVLNQISKEILVFIYSVFSYSHSFILSLRMVVW